MVEEKLSIIFLPVGTRVEVRKGTTILEAAQQGGVKIRSICGGTGDCGKCRVIVEGGQVSDKPSISQKHLTEAEVARGYHIACTAGVVTDLRVTIPAESRIEGQKMLSTATIPKIDPSPSSTKLFLPERKMIYGLSEVGISKLLTSTIGTISFAESVRKRMTESKIDTERGVTVLLCEMGEAHQVIDIEEGNTSDQFFGIAVDLGTTKVAIYLVHLGTGQIVDTDAGYNEQLIYGEDLLSRIDYVYRNVGGLDRLRKAAIATIENTLGPMLLRNKVDKRHVADVCISGNTVMTYLLAGLDPSNLINTEGKIPRHPEHRQGLDLGLSVNPMANVYFLPCVSRFVGGDAVGDILASRLQESDELSILVDMGTNGEILIGSRGWLLSTSCAAGPAFEGWEIQHGMRSIEGAIDHVKIDEETLTASYTVIGGESMRPRGLCGSGIIDTVVEMLDVDIIDFTGKMQHSKSALTIRNGGGETEYVVAPADQTEIGKDIVVTQKDITNLLESKAAVCGAIAALMRKINASVADFRKVYLSGAFGVYVDPQKAIRLGLFPEFPNAEIVQIGNGSVAGAYLALISKKERRQAEQIAESMAYYDLTNDPDFMDEYSAALTIPGRRELFPTISK